MIKIRIKQVFIIRKRYTEVDCQWLIPGYLGPSDAFDNYSIYFVTKNTLPTVCEWETLTYAHQIFVLEYGKIAAMYRMKTLRKIGLLHVKKF